jgi:transcriptional regulator with XRE-family HTH domain
MPPHPQLKLRTFIRSQHWTKAQAASNFGESKSRIGDLMNGEIDLFAVEQLVHLLSIAGIDANISIETANELDFVPIDSEFELGIKAHEKVRTKYADALHKLAQ